MNKLHAFYNSLNLFISGIFIVYYTTTIISTVSILQGSVIGEVGL